MFEIDFFELAFLVEACIPPVPIARFLLWEKVIDTYYHKMSRRQKNELFTWITTNKKFKKENEHCRLFYARFNPNNQWSVLAFHNGKVGVHDCFKMDDEYYTSPTRKISEEYIKSVNKIE